VHGCTQRARLYACTVDDWRLGFVDDWRLGRRALKIQISVMPPLPVRTPQELPEALKKTFGSAEEFVKEAGSYFKKTLFWCSKAINQEVADAEWCCNCCSGARGAYRPEKPRRHRYGANVTTKYVS
jgi:hypothetical protein